MPCTLIDCCHAEMSEASAQVDGMDIDQVKPPRPGHNAGAQGGEPKKDIGVYRENLGPNSGLWAAIVDAPFAQKSGPALMPLVR
jgi:hypothetical protein